MALSKEKMREYQRDRRKRLGEKRLDEIDRRFEGIEQRIEILEGKGESDGKVSGVWE